MASMDPFTTVILTLTCTRWHIHAGDAEASTVVTALAKAMSLPPADLQSKQSTNIHSREIHVFVNPQSAEFSSGGYASGPVYCLLPSPIDNDMLVLEMSYIALTIARSELSRGGLLIHGALAQTPDYLEGGIIFAGPGTVGKTTTSKRLPFPWRSLSDDASLVVPNNLGQYMVHPWPTWSRFTTTNNKEGSEYRWNVQNAVPLRAFFFLAQSEEDRIDPLPPTPAVTFLMETVQHVSMFMTRNLPVKEAQLLYKNQLTAAENIVKAIPTYTLHLSKTGAFWKNIEQTLTLDSTSFSSKSNNKPLQEKSSKSKQNTFPPSLPGDDILTLHFSGSSMFPTLRHPDLLQVVPYADKAIRCGDIIYFIPPTQELKLIHRVVSITANGICTRGDSNSADDPYLLQPSDIIGQVTAAWRNNKHRVIAGGIRGRWSGYRAGIYHRLNKLFSPLLHGIYNSLSSIRLLRSLLPTSLQPRVFEFKQRHLPPIFKLMINDHVIGYYDNWKKHWLIDRPWKLIFDDTKLPIVSKTNPIEPLEMSNEPSKETNTNNL